MVLRHVPSQHETNWPQQLAMLLHWPPSAMQVESVTHLPALQTWLSAQLVKQLPQLRGSVSKSVHTAGSNRATRI
jgi:hypothetical protein